ncbi:coproporphyrinogen-III oxidase family protein [Candidatus Uabimicrobium sp. HlEnr_7]|uniref:coproporphyrinogen-III oxidase family protein n=1 Tax=Candidatus Uabimicrobium helgolandensis TaxID=3095367 RepID=UPI003556C07C
MQLHTSKKTVDLNFPLLVKTLQPAAHAPYAPPHVFPMSAPTFSKAVQAPRPKILGLTGVYIHIPFCRYACNFCFYVKQIGATRAKMENYVQALKREIEDHLPIDTLLNQVFIGGGTPTALPPDLLDEVLTAIFSRTDRSQESSHTVECSPETLTDEHINIFKKHGIHRVSMGIQTFQDKVLDNVHRRHSGEQALLACKKLTSSGLMVNIDLIYGLPGQTHEDFRNDFELLAQLKVNCVNAYSLRVNESTPVLAVLEQQERLELEQLLKWRAFVERTAVELGYEQRHWQRFMLPSTNFELNLTSNNLIGFGASARSFIDNTVYRNHPQIKEYMSRAENHISAVEEIFELGVEHQKTYFITRSLGAGKPLNYKEYHQSFDRIFKEDYEDVCQRLLKADLIFENNNTLEMTDAGKLVYDLVTLAFYPPQLQKWLEQKHAEALVRRQPINKK